MVELRRSLEIHANFKVIKKELLMDASDVNLVLADVHEVHCDLMTEHPGNFSNSAEVPLALRI